MANGQLNLVLRHLRRIADDGSDELADRDLLERFVSHREESAFERLVDRHGPVVLGVCRRVLDNEQDAEDAFQATFLVLAGKARSIRKQASVGSWLYGVAYRVALKLKASAARRRAHERRVLEMCQPESRDEAPWQALRPALDEELYRLPEKYRAPLVLCYLEGKTNVEAARMLGWPSGSIAKRLARARELLRQRLARRGIALSSAVLTTLLVEKATAAVPAALQTASVQAAVLTAAGQAVTGVVSSQAANLAEGALRTMLLTKWTVGMIGACLAAVAVTVGLTAYPGLALPTDESQTETPARPAGKGAALQPDLALVPTNAMGVARIAVHDLWGSPTLKAVRQRLGKDGEEAVKALEEKLGVKLDDLETATLVVLPPDTMQPNVPVLAVLRTTKPLDPEQVLKIALPGAEKQTHNGKQYFAGRSGEVHFVNNRMFLLGNPGSISAYLDYVATARAQGPLSPALQLAGQRHHFFAGFRMPEQVAQAAKQAPLAEQAAFLKPLLDVESGTLVVDVGDEASLKVSVRLPDEATAKEVMNTVENGVKILRGLIAQAQGQFGNKDQVVADLLKEADAGLESVSVSQQKAVVQAVAQLKSQPLLSLALPAVQKVQTASARTQSMNNLKQMVLAMHNYHGTYGRFPPAAITDAEGKPLLSWRVAILPYIEGDALYREFKLDEPWNSEHNKKLLARMPPVYAPTKAKAKERFTTFYQVFTGPGTPFEDAKGNRIADITDGTSNTIMAVEAEHAVPWTKPEDLPFDPNKPLPKLGGDNSEGILAAFCDGSVRFISKAVEEKTLRALITRNGGESVNPADGP
jgi:RNA polymerase sigma factor (sigma-70 family)